MFIIHSNRSWCEKIILFLLSIICLIVIIDYKFTILPINGFFLIAYLFLITLCTTWIAFIYLQNMLSFNKPFEYDIEKNYALKLMVKLYNTLNKPTTTEDNLKSSSDNRVFRLPLTTERRMKNIDERIEDLVKDIEIRYILKWYTNISKDLNFPTESKQLLDEIIRRFLQVVVDIDGRKLIYCCIVVFLRHIKEFRKALKRSLKTDTPVEELYRYSHIGSKSQQAMDHFVFHITTNILRQFINWELWNSLPCRSLVSILSRKFTTYILMYVSSPGYLNYKLVQICALESTKNKLKLDKYCFIDISDIDHGGHVQDVKEKTFEKLRTEECRTPKMSPQKSVVIINSSQNSNETLLKPQSMDYQVNLRPKLSEPVKIYEPKSTKTWRNSSDLECISLGQDLLAFQEFHDPDTEIQELIDKKLWKDNVDGGEDEKSSSMWDIPESWYGEEEQVDIVDEVVASPTSNFQNYLKSTAFKPIGDVTATTIHNMKEFQQSTVNTVNNVVKPVSQATSNAMHKIGDLQDEAAGVVEGILDFGMAGLRKGLRLTGLQENFNELAHKTKSDFIKLDLHKPSKVSEAIRIVDKSKLTKTPHVMSEDKFEHESDESVWINPLTKESPSFDGDILLERTPDSIPKTSTFDIMDTKRDIPQITEDILSINSPDPEYEEAQDFASTIAKLRTLLQQKSSESGFTTPSLSPMPQDETTKTPTEQPPAVATTDLSKVDGAMPSLYKFCARTATGVFQNTLNTIKTALPGNAEVNQNIIRHGSNDWTFVEADSTNDDFHSRLKRLLSERRAFCTVDTAYEAIDSLEVIDQPEISWTAPSLQFDDELDEFEMQVPITKALLDIICELIGDTNTCLLQESVVKALLLLIGNYTEEFITKQSDSILHNINKFVGKLPENINQEVIPLKSSEIIRICLEIFPGGIKKLLGENTLEAAVGLLISSLQSAKINRDIFMQILELFTSQLINACSQVSPTYSA